MFQWHTDIQTVVIPCFQETTTLRKCEYIQNMYCTHVHLCSCVSTSTSIASMSIFAVQDSSCKCWKGTQLNYPLCIAAMNTPPENGVSYKRSLWGNGIIWLCLKVWHSKIMLLKKIIVPCIYIYIMYLLKKEPGSHGILLSCHFRSPGRQDCFFAFCNLWW
jgi:hypothetical protein